MSEDIRCPACRGSKKVAKLGGMLGDCNLCEGKGSILASNKPKPVQEVIAEPLNAIVMQVADCVPVSSDPAAFEPQVKVDGKRAIYKRKKA